MTLILWKAPLVDDSDAAKRLLQPYHERGDDSAFEPSPDLARMADELRERFPEGEDSPWASFPPDQTDRILVLDIRWAADNDVVDEIAELAQDYGLVLYDPQGPDITLPGQPVEPAPPERIRLVDYLKIVPIGLAAAGVFWLGWWIDVPVLNWILMIVGGFFLSVILFLFWVFLFPPKDVNGKTTPRSKRTPPVTLPREIAEIPWRKPWASIPSPQFEERLAKEVGRQHVLYRRRAIAIGRRYDNDDVLFFLPDGPAMLAVVHLTWSSRTPEPDARVPWTDLYQSVQEWIDRRMIPDAEERAGGSA
jgi:hypothetical protein